jgi:hypothetical protein
MQSYVVKKALYYNTVCFYNDFFALEKSQERIISLKFYVARSSHEKHAS